MPEATIASPVTQAVTQDAFLGGRLLLRQPAEGYRAGLDALLLAATVTPDVVGGGARPPLLVDLGAGVGTVGLAAACRVSGLRAVLVEREPPLAALAASNIAANALEAFARVVSLDLETARDVDWQAAGVAADCCDCVVANPPYHRHGAGRLSPDPIKARAHAMPAGGMERWARVMARLVRPGGVAAMIHRADALPELLAAFAGRFGDIAVLPIHPRQGDAAVRVIVAGRKGSRAGLRLLAGLVMHQPSSHEFTPGLQAILRDGAGLDLWRDGAPTLVQTSTAA